MSASFISPYIGTLQKFHFITKSIIFTMDIKGLFDSYHHVDSDGIGMCDYIPLLLRGRNSDSFKFHV